MAAFPHPCAPVQKLIELCVKLAAVTYFTNTENSSGTFNSAPFSSGKFSRVMLKIRGSFTCTLGEETVKQGKVVALAAGDPRFVQRQDSCSAQAEWMQRWLLMH